MDKKIYKLMNWPEIEAIVYSEECHPYNLLGPTTVGNQTLVQTFRPGVKDVFIFDEKAGVETRMECADEEGYYAALLPGKGRKDYHFNIVDAFGVESECDDAYAIRPQVNKSVYKAIQLDMKAETAKLFGAHEMNLEGKQGFLFTVWAPNALRVSVVGDFNHWDGRVHPMQKIDEYGIHILFIPGVTAGMEYMYEIKKADRNIILKADPYERCHTVRPENHSVTVSDKVYAWTDKNYLDMKSKQNAHSFPVNILKVHPSMLCNMPEFADKSRIESVRKLIAYAVKASYTHIELMGSIQHPYDETLGREIIGYYAPNSKYWENDDLKQFVDEAHRQNIGVILDWSVAGFPKDDFGLCEFDGRPLYEYADSRKAEKANGSTRLFDLARYEVRNYLLGSAVHWLSEYHVDGLKLDNLSGVLFYDYDRDGLDNACNMYGSHENLEACDFFRTLNKQIHKEFPYAMLIAEEPAGYIGVTDTDSENGLSFDLKCDGGFSYGLMDYFKFDPYFRMHHQTELTDLNIYQFCEKYMIPMDERITNNDGLSARSSMPGNIAEQFANLRAAYAYMMLQSGKKCSFPARVLAADKPWNIVALYETGTEAETQFSNYVSALNDFYKNQPALYERDNEERGFRWVNTTNAEKNIVIWERSSSLGKVLVVAHMANVLRKNELVGVPENGKYKEIFSTDLPEFGGSGNNVKRVRPSSRIPADGQKYSIKMNLAPLSVTVFTMIPYTEEELVKQREEEKILLARHREAEKLAKVRAKEAEKAKLAKQREAEKRKLDRIHEAEKATLATRKKQEKASLAKAKSVKRDIKQPSGKQGGK